MMNQYEAIYFLSQLVGCPSTLSLSLWDSGEEATCQGEMKKLHK
jgi:hypothetical protein